MVNEKVLSTSYEVFSADSGSDFDGTHMESVDTVQALDEGIPAQVVCSEGFGLRSMRRRIRSSPTVTDASETAPTVAASSSVMLVKSEVLLSSTLETLQRNLVT